MTRQHPQPPVPRRGLALAVLLLPISLTLLSVTSINVALPAIRQSLALTGSEQALVLTSYTVAFALVLLPAGRAGDRYGHKRVFLVGVVAFTLACAWCALAPDATQLILARVLAGIAGGLVLTPLNALIQLLYGSHERARPFAIMGAVFGAASAAGPVLGGLLMQVGGEYGWHLVFWINVPFGVLAIAAAALLLPPDAPLGAHGSDPLGLLLFSLGVVTVVLPFATGTGVTPMNAGMLGAGLAMLVAFALWERRRERAERFAIVPLRLWQRPLTVGVISTLLGFAAFTGSFLMLALLWLDGLGRSAIEAGLVVTPFAFGSIIGSIASRPLSDRFGVRVSGAGLLLITAGLTLVGVLIATLPPASITFLLMLAPLLTIGFGVGLFVGPNTNAAFALTEHRDAGVASAMITTAQRTGTAVGIGVLSALYALAPGGSASLANQTTASVISASLAAAAVLVLLVGRRNRSVPAPAHAAVPAP